MRVFGLQKQDEQANLLSIVLQRTLKPHNAPVTIAKIDETGTLLATGSADTTVKIWDIRGGYVTHTFRGHGGVVSALHFFRTSPATMVGSSTKKKKSSKPADFEQAVIETTPDEQDLGYFLASGSEDGNLRIWDLTKRKSCATLVSHVSVVRGIDYSNSSAYLVSASRDRTIILWDAKTWKVKRVIPVLEVLEAVNILYGGDFICTGGENGRVRLWSAETGLEVTQGQEPGSETEAIVQMLYKPHLDVICSVHVDYSLTFHSTLSARSTPDKSSLIPPLPISRRISGTHDEIIDMAFAGQDHALLALATNTESVRLISLGRPGSQVRTTIEPSYFGADVALLNGHEDIIICMTIDHSGHWLATGAKDNTARLWRIDGSAGIYEHYATCTGHTESIGAVCFPNLQSGSNPRATPPPFLLTGSQDRTIKHWQVPRKRDASMRALYTRKAHDKDINALAIANTSQLFASASQDRTVKIWSIDEGETQGILRGHKRGVWSVAFAPKDAGPVLGDSGPARTSRGMILTGSGDKTVKIWSLSDYSCLRTFEGHANSALKVLWLPAPQGPTEETNASLASPRHSSQVASAGGDGLVKIWDTTSGECVATLDNHTDRIWALAVEPNSRTLVSGGGDGVLTFWKDTTTETATARDQAATERIEQDQDLVNRIHDKQYREAITLALALNHPGRLLSLFQAVVDTDPAEPTSITGVVAIDEIIASLSDEQLLSLLKRIRDWNTNARTCAVAQRLLNVIVRSYPATRLAKLGKMRGGKEVVAALQAYTGRHFQRTEELWGESWIVEFLLGEMGGLMDDRVNGHEGGMPNGTAPSTGEEDVIMV